MNPFYEKVRVNGEVYCKKERSEEIDKTVLNIGKMRLPGKYCFYECYGERGVLLTFQTLEEMKEYVKISIGKNFEGW